MATSTNPVVAVKPAVNCTVIFTVCPGANCWAAVGAITCTRVSAVKRGPTLRWRLATPCPHSPAGRRNRQQGAAPSERIDADADVAARCRRSAGAAGN